MHISALEEYGLRCALQLARVFGQGPLSASKIAEKEGISVEYVSKIMHLFRKAEVVQAVRGIQGGFTLARTPTEITLMDVFESMKNNKKSAVSFCKQYTGLNPTCVHIQDCSIRPVWHLVSGYFDSVLKELSLQDLMDRENQTRKKIEGVAQSHLQKLKSHFTEESSAHV